jgi:glycine/D-amino acid oxidase-like deaminating enzyme
LQYVHGRPIRLATLEGHPEFITVQLHDIADTGAGEITLPCTDLVLAAGPWTGHVLRTLDLPTLPISNLPGHSIIIRAPSERTIPATAVFSRIHDVNLHREGDLAIQKTTESPEFCPREDGTVYVAGENDAAPLPEDPALVEDLTDEDISERLVRAVKYVSTIYQRERWRSDRYVSVSDSVGDKAC